MQKNILITGFPGVGKTTLLIKIFEHFKRYKPVGFYTQEIRLGSERLGFRISDFYGRETIFAHVNLKSKYKVGKYFVDVAGFDEFISAIPFKSSISPLLIIDEIGKMEIMSLYFRELLVSLLNLENILIASISSRSDDFFYEIKSRTDVDLYNLEKENRDEVYLRVIQKVNSLLKK